MAEDPNVAAVRAAVVAGAALAESFMVGEARFYVAGNTTPVFRVKCRVKLPRPSSFDAGNSTEAFRMKRAMVISIPNKPTDLDGNDVPEVIEEGLVVQVSGADDPTINNVNFAVQSSVGATFAATREVSVVTEMNKTARIV